MKDKEEEETVVLMMILEVGKTVARVGEG